MLTPLSITSLDQGREFARQEIRRLYAEPQEPVADIAAADIKAVVRRPALLSILADFIDLWRIGYSMSVRRY